MWYYNSAFVLLISSITPFSLKIFNTYGMHENSGTFVGKILLVFGHLPWVWLMDSIAPTNISELFCLCSFHIYPIFTNFSGCYKLAIMNFFFHFSLFQTPRVNQFSSKLVDINSRYTVPVISLYTNSNSMFYLVLLFSIPFALMTPFAVLFTHSAFSQPSF